MSIGTATGRYFFSEGLTWDERYSTIGGAIGFAYLEIAYLVSFKQSQMIMF